MEEDMDEGQSQKGKGMLHSPLLDIFVNLWFIYFCVVVVYVHDEFPVCLNTLSTVV